MTGRRFIYGGKVRQIKVTIEAPTKVTVAEAYQAFLSALQINGLTVIPHGRYLKIVESAGVVTESTPVLGAVEPVPEVDRYVTRLYRLRHVSADEVANVLNKFKSKDGDITTYPPGNLVIVTDTGSNIRRMLRITEELDAARGGEKIWMQPIHHVPASDLAAQLNEMLDTGSGGAGRSRIIADDRSNALIMITSEDDYKRLLPLIDIIDRRQTGEGGVHVLPLQHAQCDELQPTLNALLGGGGATAARAGQARAPGAAPAVAGGGGAEQVFEGDVKVLCDEATNSLVAQSSLRDYAQLRNVIDQLDRPRRQVFIEAVIMDVSIDHSTDWGIGYHGGGALGDAGNPTIIYGGNNPGQSLLGVPANLEALAFGVRGPNLEGSQSLLGTGVSIPAFGVVLHALALSGDSNVLATPHILATDNIAADISIGQNIALQTNVGGGLGNLAGLAGGQQGAAGLGALGGLLGGGLGFQAPRQDVGIHLKITPHINDSDQVRMEISEEFSTPGAPEGALGVVPINKRTAETTVVVKDQQTVVIGGLVREDHINSQTKIPVLGDIPVLGVLFRQQNKRKAKNNLLLVLTPHIIRDQNDLRRIFERKMQERQEFLDRYFVFDESLPWEPPRDYSRTNGLVENIRQTQLELAERERLAAELDEPEARRHEPVKPLTLPSIAGSGQARQPATGGGAARQPRPNTQRPNRPQQTNPNQPQGGPGTMRRNITVPGGARRQERYRIE
jgi:general secretion pathway protein D